MNILLADDNKAYRQEFAERFLQNHSVTYAGTPDEEIDLAAQTRYDLIISDCEFGCKKTGLDAIETIRLRDPSVPIFFMSAYPAMEVFIEALEIGANDAMQKKTDPKTIQQTIENLL